MDSRLEEFEKKLYKPGAEEKKQESYEVYKEETIGKKWGGWEGGGRPFGQARRGRGLSVVLLFFFASLAVVGGYYWYTMERPFDQKSVQGEISGPARISSGDEVAFTVTYRNNADVALRDTKLLFTWPEGVVLLDGTSAREMKADVGTIVPRQEKSVTFKGRMYGAKDQEKEIAVAFQYTPETVASVFEDKKKITVSIVATPIAMTVTAPAQVVSEKEMQIDIEYQNQSDAKFENMELRATYPSGFQPIAFDPAPSTDANVWKLGTIEGRAGGKVTVRGVFSGTQGESKSLYFEIGAKEGNEFLQYATGDSSVMIATSALFVFQTVNDSRDYTTNPGASLRYRIRYKNTTNIQIPNAVILARIDESLVDVKTLAPQWGSFDGRTNSIIWNSVGVPELAVLDPKEEGEVSFSVNVKSSSSFMPKKFSDKNFTVTSTARITAAASPESLAGLPLESEDSLSIKVHTQFSFNEIAYYEGSPIQNTGSLPLRVGERTTFAISWQLSNTINDVDDIEVTAVVPPNVEWTGVVYPQDANITYDRNNGVITWKPGKVFAGTGFLTPPKRVDFQVAFVPALVHVGQTVNLVSAANLKATDTFTGLKMERQVPQVNSDLLNSLKRDEGRVMQ